MFESIFGSLIAALIVKLGDKINGELSGHLKKGTDVLRKAELEKEMGLIKRVLKEEKHNLESGGVIKALSEPLEKAYVLSHIKGLLERAWGMWQQNKSLENFQNIRLFFVDGHLWKYVRELSKPFEQLNSFKEKGMETLINYINDGIPEIVNSFNVIEKEANPQLIGILLPKCHKLEENLFELTELMSKNV